MTTIGLGISSSKSQLVNDPSSINDLIAWFDFTDESTLRQDRDGTGTVSANNDPVEYAINIANGDDGGNILGGFMRSQASGSSFGATFKTSGQNGLSYLQFADDASDNNKGFRSGFFGVSSIPDGGIAADKFSNVVIDAENWTIIQVLKHDDDDISTTSDYSFELKGYKDTSDTTLAVISTDKTRFTPDEYRCTLIEFGGATGSTLSANGQLDENFHVIITKSKGVTDGFKMEIDGTVQTDTATPPAFVIKFDKSTGGTSNGSPGFSIGAGCNVSTSYVLNSWQGAIYETIVYNRALTDDEMAFIELYLSNKYAITFN